jgi:hypothetical protein
MYGGRSSESAKQKSQALEQYVLVICIRGVVRVRVSVGSDSALGVWDVKNTFFLLRMMLI